MSDAKHTPGPFVVRFPALGDAPAPEFLTRIGERDAAWLEDTRTGACVFTDGMEPEDACLGRDLDAFVEALNEEAAKTALLLAAAERALEQLLDVNPQPVRTVEALRSAIAKAKGGAT